jgi:Na+-translocating ferredoxin:NAD+ oxidoreductase RnfC subunit
VVIAIKEKNIDILDILKPLTADLGYEYKIMRNVYPAGDEYVLVFEITGRQIPPGWLTAGRWGCCQQCGDNGITWPKR